MFRTRDYAILLAIIVFLLVAIGATLLSSRTFELNVSNPALTFVALQGEEESGVVEKADPESLRASRLEAMKKKIAALREEIFEEPPVEEQPITLEVPEEGEAVVEKRCATYREFAGTWNPAGIIIDEVEGARLVYREIAPVMNSSSTPAAPSREILMQLPLRSLPFSAESCINSDVIGIAMDGSLIRNSEASVYQVFEAETLIGYALDGFPIYGRSATQTDICGGVIVSGQYRYQLSAERETVLNCYAGSPVSF
jgi:hypothetical protein